MSLPNGFIINLKEYCANCGHFDVDVEKLDCSTLSQPNTYITTISCRNMYQCERVANLEKVAGCELPE